MEKITKEFFMNYAEGQGAPTVKYEDETDATKEAKRLAEKLGVEVITLKAVKNTCPKDITKRVKSYADACNVIGIEPMNEEVLAKLGFTNDEIAYRKLKTIVEALNEGWKPNWANNKENKYWPWFEYPRFPQGLYLHDKNVMSGMCIYNPPLLCYKTKGLARYAGIQFKDIYYDFLQIKD